MTRILIVGQDGAYVMLVESSETHCGFEQWASTCASVHF